MLRDVRPERTGWRDQALSERHRFWGVQAPMQDLDFVVMEYSSRLPSAVIEYKNERAMELDREHPGVQAMIALAGDLPCFCVRYSSDLLRYTVIPLNAEAQSYVDTEREVMNELEYVELLYRFRSYHVPPQIRYEIEGRAREAEAQPRTHSLFGLEDVAR